VLTVVTNKETYLLTRINTIMHMQPSRISLKDFVFPNLSLTVHLSTSLRLKSFSANLSMSSEMGASIASHVLQFEKGHYIQHCGRGDALEQSTENSNIERTAQLQQAE